MPLPGSRALILEASQPPPWHCFPPSPRANLQPLQLPFQPQLSLQRCSSSSIDSSPLQTLHYWSFGSSRSTQVST